MLQMYERLVLRQEWGITPECAGKDFCKFTFRGRRYLIGVLPIAEEPEWLQKNEPGLNRLVMVTRENWTPPAETGALATLDLTTHRLKEPRDPIQLSFVDFVRSHYGLKGTFA